MLRHVKEPGGISVFSRNIMQQLLSLEHGIDFHLLYQSPDQREVLGHLPGKHVVLPSRRKLVWDQVAVPAYARRERLDLVLNTKLSVPLRCASRTAFVLPSGAQFIVPWVYPLMDRIYTRLMMPLYGRKADAIITHTETGRNSIVEHLGVDASKIEVIPHGVHEWLTPASEAEKQRVRAKYRLPARYVLFLGGVTPLKNVGNLFRAFAQTGLDEDVGLVLAGFRRFRYQQELDLVDELSIRDRVQQVGFVPDEDLAALYSAAQCYVLPSWYEGFGIPMIEAMACGCPVVASTGGAMPEVTGGAALLVDPAQPEQIAAALTRFLGDSALRDEYRTRGFARARMFSWRSMGESVREVIERLVAPGTAARNGHTGERLNGHAA